MQQDISVSGSSSESDRLEDSIGEMEETHDHILDVDQMIDEVQPNIFEHNDFKKFENIICKDMVFDSEELAFEKYNEFARQVGFSVRKGKTYKRADGTIRSRMFFCSKQGTRANDKRNQHVKKERKQTRTDCKARIIVKHQNNNEWVVSEIVFEHNHPLATPSKTYLLRSQRKLKEAQAAEIDSLNIVGISPTDGFSFMSQQAGGHENVGITPIDYKNYLRNRRKQELGDGDAERIINYFTQKKSENPAFFYSVKFDNGNNLSNFFWADAMSIIDYNYFGDVVVFDTTYRTNKYNRPFAPFVGVNHHKQTIIFGAALLLDESAESFVWLFETWLKAMARNPPKTIITDQDAAIAKAISIVMPQTSHRLCLWHIFQNAAKHLFHVYTSSDFKFFFNRCIYTYESEEEFVSRWEKLLQDYSLVGNKWLDELFKIRQKWALVYGHDTFCADMTTSQHSESINKFFKKFVKRKYTFTEFLARYETAIKTRRRSELEADFDQIQKMPNLYIPTPMLKQAASSYTHAVFEMFEKEYKEHLMCKIEDGGVDGLVHKYEVTQDGHVRDIVSVYSSDGQVVCSCQKMDFVGILCRHIIKTFNHLNIHDLPTQYILKRWTKDAKVGIVTNQVGDQIVGDPSADLSLRYNDLCRKAVLIATKSAIHENVHKVASNALDNLLVEVESAIKAIKITSKDDSKTSQGTSAENAPTIVASKITISKAKPKGRPTEHDRIMSGLEISQKKKRNQQKRAYSREEAKKNLASKESVQKGHNGMTQTSNESVVAESTCPTNVIVAHDYSFGVLGANTYQLTNPSGFNHPNQYIQGSNVLGFGANTLVTPPNSNTSFNQLLHQVSFIPTSSNMYNGSQLPEQSNIDAQAFESNNELSNPEQHQASRRKLSFNH